MIASGEQPSRPLSIFSRPGRILNNLNAPKKKTEEKCDWCGIYSGSDIREIAVAMDVMPIAVDIPLAAVDTATIMPDKIVDGSPMFIQQNSCSRQPAACLPIAVLRDLPLPIQFSTGSIEFFSEHNVNRCG